MMPMPPPPHMYHVVVSVKRKMPTPGEEDTPTNQAGSWTVNAQAGCDTLSVQPMFGDGGAETVTKGPVAVGTLVVEQGYADLRLSIGLRLTVCPPPPPPAPVVEGIDAEIGDSFIGLAPVPDEKPAAPIVPTEPKYVEFTCDLPITVTVTLTRLGGWPSPQRALRLVTDAAAVETGSERLPVVSLTGVRDAGKSTMVGLLASELSRTHAVYVADVDPGQSYNSTAGYFAVRVVGPACAERRRREGRRDFSVFMGDSTIRSLEPAKMGTRRIASEARARALASRRAACCSACSRAFVLLNTHGWLTDVGLQHLTTALDAFDTSLLLHLDNSSSPMDSNRQGDRWPVGSPYMDRVEFLEPAGTDAPPRSRHRAAERAAVLLHAITAWPLRVTPLPFRQVVLGYAADDRVMPEHVLTVAQGRVLSMVVGGDVAGGRGGGGSGVQLRVAASSTHDHGTVVGLAVLRGVDPLTHSFYLSTWLDDETLARVTQLWVGHESVAEVPSTVMPLVGGTSAYALDHVLSAGAAPGAGHQSATRRAPKRHRG